MNGKKQYYALIISFFFVQFSIISAYCLKYGFERLDTQLGRISFFAILFAFLLTGWKWCRYVFSFVLLISCFNGYSKLEDVFLKAGYVVLYVSPVILVQMSPKLNEFLDSLSRKK